MKTSFPMNPKGYVSAPEFAETNNVHISTVHRGIARGKIEAFQASVLGSTRHFVKEAQKVSFNRSKKMNRN